ncbi:MAG: GNAT family N-acetyltransferase [Bacteroidales bacterium]|nr:GNAT family N-acetyltransferase [Bacteroidales bacterium]
MEIRLRALEPEDIDSIYRWENDPDVWQHSASHTPFSRHLLTEYIMSQNGADIYALRQLRLVCDVSADPLHNSWQPAGTVDLYDFDPYHMRAGVGIMVDSALRRRGIGLAMLRQLIAFVRDNIRLHQLYCEIEESNEASLRLFEKAGFVQCGRRTQWYSTTRGREDCIEMQLLIL